RTLASLPEGDADLAAYAAEFRLGHAALAGGSAPIRAPLPALPPAAGPVKRRAPRTQGATPARFTLGATPATRPRAAQPVPPLEPPDLPGRCARAVAVRCARAPPARRDRREFTAAARAAITAAAAPGRTARRAEAALWLGTVLRDRELLDLSCDLAARLRHVPLLRRARRIPRPLQPAGAGDASPPPAPLPRLQGGAKRIRP